MVTRNTEHDSILLRFLLFESSIVISIAILFSSDPNRLCELLGKGEFARIVISALALNVVVILAVCEKLTARAVTIIGTIFALMFGLGSGIFK